DQTVELWGLPGGRPLRTLEGHTGGICCLAVSPDGGLLVSGSHDGTVRLWVSELIRLSRIPVGRMAPQDLAWAEEALAEPGLTGGERAALEFLVARVRWRWRFDTHLDEAPRRVAAGAFDIEIAG